MLSATKLIAIAAVLASLTSAQGSLPPCAQACVTQFTSGASIGGCSNIDAKCICSSSTFISSIACCLAGACNAADQETATNYALNICRTAGITNLPSAVSCTSSITSTSSVPSSSSATGAVATSSASSSESSASSVVSSLLSSATSVSSSDSSSVSSPASVSNQSGSSTSSASTPASTTHNAGSHNVAGVGAGVLGGLAAAVAML